MSKRLLLVDDDSIFLKSLENRLLECRDLFETDVSSSVDEAVALTKKNNYDLIITDINMPEKTGIDLMIDLKLNRFIGTIMVMTAYGEKMILKKIRELGGMNVIIKPIEPEWFTKMVREFFEEKQVVLGTMDEIDLTSILQVLHLEKKSLTIKVEIDNKYGFLYFEDGELINAEFEGISGYGAAFKLIKFNKGRFSVIKSKKTIKRKIEIPFVNLLMNMLKDIDHDIFHEKKDKIESKEIKRKPDIQIKEDIFDDLKEISGFKGAGIYNKDGNIIIGENPYSKNMIELGLLGLNLYEIAIYDIKKFGQGDLQLLYLQTDKMVFVFSWLLFNKIFLGVMIDIEGNLGILKHRVKNIYNSIEKYLY